MALATRSIPDGAGFNPSNGSIVGSIDVVQVSFQTFITLGAKRFHLLQDFFDFRRNFHGTISKSDTYRYALVLP